MSEQQLPSIKHYYVDESGDPALFDRRGRCCVDLPGSSPLFILGKLDVVEPARLSAELEDLRRSLLTDPYFKNVPSFAPEARKLAVAFHAKDDLPEVRQAVFRLLSHHRLRFYAVVRERRRIHQEVLENNFCCLR